MVSEIEKDASGDVGVVEELGKVYGCDRFGESLERERVDDKPVRWERRCAWG